MKTPAPLMRLIAAALVFACAAPVLAVDEAHRAKAEQLADKAIAYLRSTQGAEGNWSARHGPGITALVVTGMLDRGVAADDPTVAKAVAYMLGTQKPDGGFYDRILGTYNTSIVLMALGRLPESPRVKEAIAKGQGYLRSVQWSNQPDGEGGTVDADHPFYGGVGYGGNSRPDLSNTAMMIAGLHDSGLECTDPAYVRAMAFICKLQGNEQTADQIKPDGGFVYEVRSEPAGPRSRGNDRGPSHPVEVDAAGRSRLISYGSMTYAGFMSYLYAELDRTDARVVDAFNWVRDHYTVTENPRVGQDGYFFYIHVLARALNAWGEPTIQTADGKQHAWAHELIDHLASIQKPDGSFKNESDRWGEGDPTIATAFAVLAAEYACK